MVHRALDVVFQHIIKLTAGLILVPLLMGGVGYALDSKPTVGMRLWAQRAVYTPNFATDRFSSYLWPSYIEASLLTELLTTDSFASRLLTTIDPQSPSWPQERRNGTIADLRQNIAATPEGEHLFLVTYRTSQVDHGRTMLEKLIVAFSAEMEAIDTGTVSAAESALRNQFNTTKKDMDTAIRQAEAYRSQHPNATNGDPAYQSLVVQAQRLTDRYLSLEAQIGQVQQSESAVSTLNAAFFRVVDPPSVMPRQIITKQSPALRLAVGGLGSAFAVEALIVYVVARRDPSIRSVEEIRRQLGLRSLGSAPPLGSR
jgi:hypothetical protein